MKTPTAAPFKTQKAQFDELVESYDQVHGKGSARSRLDVYSADKPIGVKMKEKIGLLKSLVAPSAAAAAPTATPQTPTPAHSRGTVPVHQPSFAPGASAPLPQARKISLIDYNSLSATKRAEFTSQGGKVLPSIMTRADFNLMRPQEQSLFCLSGGQLTDDATRATSKPTAQGTVKRAAFAQMSAAEQLAFCQSGGRIVE